MLGTVATVIATALQESRQQEETAMSKLSYVAADAEVLRKEADVLRQHLGAVGDNNIQLQRALHTATTELRVLQTSRCSPVAVERHWHPSSSALPLPLPKHHCQAADAPQDVRHMLCLIVFQLPTKRCSAAVKAGSSQQHGGCTVSAISPASTCQLQLRPSRLPHGRCVHPLGGCARHAPWPFEALAQRARGCEASVQVCNPGHELLCSKLW